MKQKPTKQLKDLVQGKISKIKKVPGLSKIIQQQKEFIVQVNMTLSFLKVYEGNPSDFKLLIGSDVWSHYRFEECINNPEFMWESIDELTRDIVYGNKKFKITHCGIFPTIHFSEKKDKKFDEYLKNLLSYGEGGEWRI